jgi:hypothetical protein
MSVCYFLFVSILVLDVGALAEGEAEGLVTRL